MTITDPGDTREVKNKYLTIRLTTTMKRALEHYSAINGISQSAALNLLVSKQLRQEKLIA